MLEKIKHRYNTMIKYMRKYKELSKEDREREIKRKHRELT